MKIEIEWTLPFALKEDSMLIYSTSVLTEISEGSGVYIFARKYGKKITPLYVGQARNLHVRIKQQLNNAKLMKQVQNWEKNGTRVLLLGYINQKGKQDIIKVLNIVEQSLIELALAEGHPLVNIQGTRKKVHSLISKGNQYSYQISPREMFVPAQK